MTTRNSSTNPRSYIIVSTGLLLAVATISLGIYVLQTSQSPPNNNHHHPKKRTHQPPKLPEERSKNEIRKERRRLKMRSFMAMKKPMYDNIVMKRPTGEALSTISKKKAAWYIRKGLAHWEDETTIRLDFEPNDRVHLSSSTAKQQHQQLKDYNQTIKKNCCVACGSEKDYRRHYVVPYAYRCRFPSRFKTHMPHDVVILCPDCHLVAQNASQLRARALEDKLRTRHKLHESSHVAAFVDPHVQAVRSAASALLKWKDRLPPAKVEAYQQVLRDHYKLSEQEQLSLEQLTKASELEPRSLNPHFVSGPELVERHLCSDPERMEAAITEFVQEWRVLFQMTLRPQHLPEGWNLSAPVKIDTR